MKRLLIALVAVAAFMAAMVAPSAAENTQAAARADSTLTLVHGIPGEADFPVDITVKGKFRGTESVFEGVTFGTVAEVPVPFDKYKIEIRLAGETGPPVLKARTWVGFRDKAVVAHLDADGAPKISKFSNTLWFLREGQAAATVRHVAAAPKVDVIANDALTLIDGLKNSRQGRVKVPADTYNIKVAADADNSVVVFDADLKLAEGMNLIAYAIGSLDDGSFQVVTQVKEARYILP